MKNASSLHGCLLIKVLVIVKQPFRVFQPGMVPVLFRQDDPVGWNAPVDAQVGVVPCQCALALRRVEVVALVLEDDLGSEHAEPVGEAPGYEELAMVVLCQLHGDMLPEGGGTLADVHRHVEHGTLDHPYQLALRVRRLLEMQSAQHAVT